MGTERESPGLFDDLGEMLKAARLQRRWTQLQLADRARLTKTQISHYERGGRMPSLVTLDRLLGALGMDLYDLAAALEEEERRDQPGSQDRPAPGRRGRRWSAETVPEAELRRLIAACEAILAALGRDRDQDRPGEDVD